MPPKRKRSGGPARGYRWEETTSGKIPNPRVVPVAGPKKKLKPMRSVSSGTNAAGKAFMKINNRTRGY